MDLPTYSRKATVPIPALDRTVEVGQVRNPEGDWSAVTVDDTEVWRGPIWGGTRVLKTVIATIERIGRMES